MPPDEKMATVMGNAACLVCAAWDHSVHKFPGGKPAKELKCSKSSKWSSVRCSPRSLVPRDSYFWCLPLCSRLRVKPGTRTL